MITLHNNSNVLRSVLLILALAISGLFFASSASADFNTQQKGIYETNYKLFTEMDGDINNIVNFYVNSDKKVYWNDDKVIGYYQNYLDNLVTYQTNLDQLWSLSSKAYAQKKRNFSKNIKGVKASHCSADSKRIKDIATRAKKQHTAASNNYRFAYKAYNASKGKRDDLNKLSIEIAELINGEKVPETDGYKDDGVYEFGSHNEIELPKGSVGGSEELDPALMDPLVEALYNYDDKAIDVFEASFAKRLDVAISLSKKGAQLTSSCR